MSASYRGTWKPPTAARIAATSEALHLGLSGEEIQRYARMAPDFSGPHTRAVDHWHSSQPDRRHITATPGTDPWNAGAYEIDLKGRPSGPLDGLTLAVKESIAVSGVPCEAGSGLLRGHVPHTDATVVTRALHAGARITYTGRMGDLGLTITGETGPHGPVLNPWSPDHITWGSSAGAAALVTAGRADAALMVDQAGSGRAPAAGCGLVSVMPTRGLIPMTGIGGFTPIQDRVAIAARHTYIAAQLASALTGADGRDVLQGPDTHPRDWAAGLVPDTHGLRIGLVKEALAPDLCAPDVAAVVRGYARDLGLLGATVTEVSIPEYALAADVAMLLTVHGGVPAMLASHLGSSPTTLAGDPDQVARFAANRHTHPEQLADTVRLCAAAAGDDGGQPHGWWLALVQALIPQVTAAYDAPLTGPDAVDILLTPTVPTTPPPAPGPDQTPEQQLRRALGAGITHTCAANLTGRPAVQVPAGLVAGLPVGIHLTALPLREDALLRCAYVLEPAGGHPLAPTRRGEHR